MKLFLPVLGWERGQLPSVCTAQGAEVSPKGASTESHRELRKRRGWLCLSLLPTGHLLAVLHRRNL